MINLLSKISFSLRQKPCTALWCGVGEGENDALNEGISREKMNKIENGGGNSSSQTCLLHHFRIARPLFCRQRKNGSNKLIAGNT